MNTRDAFIPIPCGTCATKTLVLGDRPRPRLCARCKAPFDAASVSFRRPEAPSPPPGAAAPAAPVPERRA